MFGPQFLDYMAQCDPATGPQVVACTEVHQAGDKVMDSTAKLTRLGFYSYWTEAQPTDAGGLSGGTMVATKSWIPSSHIAAAPGEHAHDQYAAPFDDVTPVVVRLAGFSFVLISLYLTPGIFLKGRNARKLACIAAWVDLYSLPWIVIGDWNIPPGMLSADPWLQKVDGSVILPSNTLTTCSAGHGAMLDYAVVSRAMRPWMHSIWAEYMPWKPHMGIFFKIDTPLLRLATRTLSAPITRILPKVNKNMLMGPGQSCTDENGAQLGWTWEQCTGFARDFIPRPSNTITRGGAAYLVDPEAAEEAGRLLGAFFTAAEAYHAKMDSNKDISIHKAIGRAAGPNFVCKEVLHGTRPKALLPTTAASPALRWWGLFTTHLGFALNMLQLREIQSPAFNFMALQNLSGKIAGLTINMPQAHKEEFRDCPPPDHWAMWMADVSLHPLVLMVEWMGYAKKIHGRLRYHVINSMASDFFAWVRLHSLPENHCTALFRWTKGTCRPLPSSAQGIWHPGVIDEPLQMAAHRRFQWSQWWCANPENLQRTLERLDNIRKMAMLEDFVPFTMEDLDKALYTLVDTTALGADFVSPRFIKNLPYMGRLQLLFIINFMLKRCMWPWQLLLNLISLMGKPLGGERPICVANFITRLALRMLRPEGRQWSRQYARHWDHAVAKSSALRSAVIQAFLVESAKAQGLDWAVILYDLQKFYDTIQLPTVLAVAVRFMFPLRTLVMVVINYVAPRVIKAGASFSDATQPVDSILAGCQQANDMARIALYRLLDKMHILHPKAPLNTFVDDIRQYAEGKRQEVIRKILPAVRYLVLSVKNLGFKFSDKSVVVSSDPMITHLVACAAAANGIAIKTAQRATDLGVDISSTKRRDIAKMMKRTSLATKRNRRTIKLRYNKLRAKAFLQAVPPQQTYGVEAKGMAPTSLARLAGDHAVHLGAKPGWCSTTVLALEAPQGDPYCNIYKRCIVHHIGFLHREVELRLRLEESWQFYLDKLRTVAKAARWKEVDGPTSSTIAMLMDIHWKPESSTLWVDPSGQQWALNPDSPSDNRDFLTVVFKSMQQQRWQKAAGHNLGGGLDQVPDLHVPRRFLTRLRAKGHHAEAAMALNIMAAGLWTNVRAEEAGYPVGRMCPLCGLHEDTLHNRCWGNCPSVMNAALPEVEATTHLVAWANIAPLSDQAMLLRGLPAAHRGIPQPSDQMDVDFVGIFHMLDGKIDVSGHEVFLDESGGEFTSDGRLKRCGWGLALVQCIGELGSEHCKFLAGVSGTLPGSFQSTSRACLEAFIFILGHSTGPLVVKPDASYLVDGFHSRRYLTPEGTNADLWHAIGILINNRDQDIQVIKVEAHIKDGRVLEGDICFYDFFGNHMADAMAARGAKMHAVPSAIAQEQMSMDARATLVLKRLVAINMHFVKAAPRRSGQTRPDRLPGMNTLFQRLAIASGHAFPIPVPKSARKCPVRLKCQTCLQGSSRKVLKAWLKAGHCPGEGVKAGGHGAEVHKALPLTAIRVGRVDLHRSHLLQHRLGLWWCAKCGYYTTCGASKSSAKLLRKECRGVAADAGKDYLKRIHDGLMPKHGQTWPEPSHTSLSHLPSLQARPLVRLRAKTTLSLQPLQAIGLPDPAADPGAPSHDNGQAESPREFCPQQPMPEDPGLELGGGPPVLIQTRNLRQTCLTFFWRIPLGSRT